MKPNKRVEYINIESLVADLDGPAEVWSFNKGSVENKLVENTHGVYYYRNDWGVITAYIIDASHGCGVPWEIKA